MDMKDIFLKRWSTTLLMLALLTVGLVFATPLASLLQDSPIMLIKGTETWKTSLYALPLCDAVALVSIILCPQIAWVFGIFQILHLALNYRRGKIFDTENTSRFIKLGYSLFLMGVLEIIAFPAANYLLFLRKISPWLGDMPILSFIQPDMIMAGAFFIVLGKIMHRGLELQETDELTV